VRLHDPYFAPFRTFKITLLSVNLTLFARQKIASAQGFAKKKFAIQFHHHSASYFNFSDEI